MSTLSISAAFAAFSKQCSLHYFSNRHVEAKTQLWWGIPSDVEQPKSLANVFRRVAYCPEVTHFRRRTSLASCRQILKAMNPQTPGPRRVSAACDRCRKNKSRVNPPFDTGAHSAFVDSYKVRCLPAMLPMCACQCRVRIDWPQCCARRVCSCINQTSAWSGHSESSDRAQQEA